jgi:hypothetical protein
MTPFDVVFPEIGLREYRFCEVPSGAGFPGGKFLMREHYCTEPDCDCRRVVVLFLPFDGPKGEVAASITYGWERQKYYKKWTRDPDPKIARMMSIPHLERLGPQGPHAGFLLRVFEKAIQNREVVASFRRHYAMVKERTSRPSLADAPLQLGPGLFDQL